ncbi:MAG: hypothetical protein OJF61_001391 [Rhodanobacteraceae bacterium]|jgi:hypothetical protein|nr:MAG: hypothetical protein OJF61_001391 [Rhodanobacteraceae bacterium]
MIRGRPSVARAGRLFLNSLPAFRTYNRESTHAFSDRGGRVNDILIGTNDTAAVELDPHFGNRQPARRQQ